MPHSEAIYFVINKQSGTVLDLVLGDRRTVAGHNRHGQDNQRWKFIKHDDGWVIQNVATDQYLGVEKSGAPANGDKIIADETDNPLKWDVRPDGTGDGWHFIYKGTVKNVDLEGGFTAPGTTVFLYDGWNGPNQIWRLEEVALLHPS